jgi:hypothetical protein
MTLFKKSLLRKSLSPGAFMVFFICLACAFGLSVQSLQAAPQNPVAEEYFNPDGIDFVPVASFTEITITLSFPNGQIARKTFEGGKDARISLGESWGPKYTDGMYTYELRALTGPKPNPEYRGAEWEGIYTPQAVVQSGFFYVSRGTVENPEEEEGQEKARIHSHGDSPIRNGSVQDGGVPNGTEISVSQNELSTAKDVCYADDLIVDGSLCVGFDCVCNYSFGFDTIVLKENNLRIFFDDTSVANSFPRNDWRIIINDSANGGASYFGIEDSTAARRPFTVEAGARSHSLYVDDGGRIGIRTSTPSTEIHVVDGDTPTLRLQQDGSSGFAPQTWDLAGNETSFFIRDASNGSTLPFRIQPGAGNNALTIRADGKVGQGTFSPSFQFHQSTTGSNAQFVADRTDGARCQLAGTASAGFFGTLNDFPVRVIVNNSQRAQFNNDNSVTMANGASLTAGGIWTDASSRELKDNIKELSQEEADNALKGLNPVTYNYKAETAEKHVGFIAEEVPELVAMNNRKGLAPMEIVAVLTKVLKQQQVLNQNQQNLNKKQEDTISQLQKRIEELEKNIASEKKNK